MAVQAGTLLLTHDDRQILAARPMEFPISVTVLYVMYERV